MLQVVHRVLCAGACALTVLAATAADAAPINYGDFVATSVMYLDVTESSATDDTPMFGPPTVTADTLDFDPFGFAATANNGDIDLTDGQLNYTLMALPGAGVRSMLLRESGDYSLMGNGTDATLISAGVSARVDILEVDGVALDEPIGVFVSTQFSADLVANPGMVQPWKLSLLVDFASALFARDIRFDLGVTKAEVVIDNQLLAISEPGTAAFIAKKDFKLLPEIEGDPIPEPASLALLTLGGLLLRHPRR